MKFSIEKDVLLDAIQHSDKALSNRTPMPILTGIKLDVDYKEIVITTSNSDISMQVKISGDNVKISEKGIRVIPGKFFVELIRKLEGATVNITTIDNNLINIQSGKSSFTLTCMEKELYPEITFNILNEPLVIKTDQLRSIINQTNFATSTIENRPILTGVLFNVENNKLKCISTDSYRLAQKEITLKNTYEDVNVVIPRRSLEELSRILVKEIDVEVYCSENKIVFKYDNIIFQSRLLEGRFPDTSKLIPKEFPLEITFDRFDLVKSLERASLLHTATKEATVKLKLKTDGKVEITSENSNLGNVVEDIVSLEYKTESEFNIAFSSKYVITALKSFEAAEVTMYFSGVVKPFIIKSELEEGVLQLILPVRVE